MSRKDLRDLIVPRRAKTTLAEISLQRSSAANNNTGKLRNGNAAEYLGIRLRQKKICAFHLRLLRVETIPHKP